MPTAEEQVSWLNNYLPVPHETHQRLCLYHELLIKWQKRINLIGGSTIHDIWRRHFLDSLQLQKLIQDLSLPMIDLGSGAGFPGMPLAMLGAGAVHLVESDGKKAAFLREVSRVTQTLVTIHHGRIETLALPPPAILLARACSPLDQLLTWTEVQRSYETVCLFHKGQNYSHEMLDAEKNWLFDYSVTPSVTDTKGVILKITNIRKRGHDGKRGR